jgi:hypothetical protein
MLAPLLLGIGIEVRHHRTFLARLTFTLIGLAAFGFHPGPSLSTAAWYNQVVQDLGQNSATELILKLIFVEYEPPITYCQDPLLIACLKSGVLPEILNLLKSLTFFPRVRILDACASYPLVSCV